MGTQRSESERGEQRGARFEATNGKAGEVRVQVQQRSAKAKQSKVNNFANYAKANRQKVNINIHLAGVKRGEREGERRGLLTMARQMPSKLKMRRKT